MMLQRVSCPFVFVVSLIFTAVGTDEAAAQPKRVKAKGKVVTVIGNQVTLLDAEKGLLTVRPKAETPLVEVSGPWKLDEIKLPMIVRLTGLVKSNSIEEEVTELTLHSPADGYQLGIQQDAPDQPATIVGQFVRIKDRQLTIAVGKRRINARLAKDATANVESKDFRFVSKGDEIEIDSYTTNSGILSGRTIKVALKPAKPPDDGERAGKETSKQEN